MELTVKQRLIKFIKYKELSQGKFEKLIGASNGFVNNISKSIGAEKLQSILYNFPELNADWLLFGLGNMLKMKPESTKIMNYTTPPTDVVMSREIFNQISQLTETVISQQRTIEQLIAQIQKIAIQDSGE